MIYKKCVMTIDKNKATLDEDIYLYRLDKNIELYFTIVNNKYRFNKGDMNNIILITNASFFQVRLYKNAEIKYTFAIQPTDGGQAILTITDDLIDDPIEVGDYDFQISLLDEEKTSMISMPIVSKQLHVCEPLVSDDATMGKAILGLSKLATGEIKNAFDSEGNYIREIHQDGDILSASIINKFEEALDTNTKAIKNGTGTSYDDTEIKTDINTIKTDLGTEELTTTAKNVKGAVNEVAAQYKDMANNKADKNSVFTMANMGQDIKEAMTGGSVAVVGKNSVLTENIADGQITKRKTAFYKKSINLENRDLFVDGKGITTANGELYDNPNLSAFEEYVAINCEYISYERFTADGVIDDQHSEILVAFYGTDKSWISCNSIKSRAYIQVPSNAKYIRIQIQTTYLIGAQLNILPKKEIDGVYLEQFKLDEIAEFDKEIKQLKNGESIQDESIKPNKTTFFNIYANLFNSSKAVVGAILKDNGILDNNFDQWRATDWIKVKGGTTIYFSNDGEPYKTHLGALFDIDKKYLSPINDATLVKVVQDGYMRVSQNGGFPDKYQIEVGQVTKYKVFGNDEIELKPKYLGNIMDNIANKYEGKNYLLLGDSITALGNNDYGWEYHFRKIMKPNRVVNISVNGCSWKDKGDTPAYDGNPVPESNLNVIGNQVQKVINQKVAGNTDYDNFDVIIIACGTNDDYDLNNPETDETIEAEFVTGYGTNNFAIKPINDVNRKTFAGIMRYTYEKLNELYPNAIFFVTTPLQEVYESYKSIKAKGDLIDAVADRLSINTINARRCGILNIYESPVGDIDYDHPTGSSSNHKRDLSDGIHTNKNGAKKLGEFIARDVINYFNF